MVKVDCHFPVWFTVLIVHQDSKRTVTPVGVLFEIDPMAIPWSSILCRNKKNTYLCFVIYG